VTTLDDAHRLAAGKPSEPAVVVDDVSKRFRLYRERASSLKETITARRGRRARFEDFWALRDVSLSIPKGTTYGLIGHNGSGKSTLLRVMAGIHPPTSGTVRTEGRISALLELGAGFHPELSGRENIYLNGSILGLTRREINAVLGDIIEFSGLEGHFIDSPVKHYSSGMYVRLGFSIAVHVKPDILMIDEVIAVGDEEFQRRCFDHLYKLRREGVTIVIVSHSAPMMEQMCDEVSWLDHGHLRKTGPAADVVRGYLDVVNTAQNERLADTGMEHVDEGAETARRWGTREIEVLGFDLCDPAGNVLTVARAGEPLTIRIRYDAKERVEEPVFGLGFRTETGVMVAGPFTRFASFSTGVLHGEGSVDFVIDRFPLLPGVWQLSVAILDESMLHTYDQLEQIYKFNVQPGESIERFGVVDLNGTWRVNG
jgi:homopolymeric O-antigen transport system ATP-binding protein